MAHSQIRAADISGGSGLIAGGSPVTLYGYTIEETAGSTNETLVITTGSSNTSPGSREYTKPNGSNGTQVAAEVITKSTTSVAGNGWPAHGVYFPFGIYVKLTGGTPKGVVWYS
jgi:hypothetical protein